MLLMTWDTVKLPLTRQQPWLCISCAQRFLWSVFSRCCSCVEERATSEQAGMSHEGTCTCMCSCWCLVAAAVFTSVAVCSSDVTAILQWCHVQHHHRLALHDDDDDDDDDVIMIIIMSMMPLASLQPIHWLYGV